MFFSKAGCMNGLGAMFRVPNSNAAEYGADEVTYPTTSPELSFTSNMILLARNPVSLAGASPGADAM